MSAILRALAALCRTEWVRDDEPADKWDWCREAAGAARDEYDRMRADMAGMRSQLDGSQSALARALAELTRLRSQRDRLAKALLHVSTALEHLKPCGHDGDEESGQCDEDCQRCEWDGAVAHVEHALAEIAKEGDTGVEGCDQFTQEPSAAGGCQGTGWYRCRECTRKAGET